LYVTYVVHVIGEMKQSTCRLNTFKNISADFIHVGKH